MSGPLPVCETSLVAVGSNAQQWVAAVDCSGLQGVPSEGCRGCSVVSQRVLSEVCRSVLQRADAVCIGQHQFGTSYRFKYRSLFEMRPTLHTSV